MIAAQLDENGIVTNIIQIDGSYFEGAVAVDDGTFVDIGFVYCPNDDIKFQDPKEQSDKYDTPAFAAGRAVFAADYLARYGVEFDFAAYLVERENAIYATDEYLDSIGST